MDIVFDLLLMAHLMALLAAGATVVAIPMIGTRLATASPEVRPILGGLAQQIGGFARIAFGVLLVSGPLMVWLRFGGVAGMTPWFWVKMGLVVVMAVAMGVNGRFRQKAMAGDARAAAMVRAGAMIARLALVGVIAAAVLAFN